MPTSQRFSSSHDSSLWRVSLFTCIVASIMWLGAVNVRALIGNDILKPGQLAFQDYIDPQAEREVYRLISITSIAVIAGYAATLVSAIVFLLSSPFKLKQHGWLMMSAILFFIFVPVELYTHYLDWKMIYLEFYTSADIGQFREVFLARVMALQGVPFIALLCYYTIITLAVFQPLKKLVPGPSTTRLIEQVGPTYEA